MSEVRIVPAGDRAGVYVGCDKGIVGVEAVEGQGLRLVLWPAGTPFPADGGPPPAPAVAHAVPLDEVCRALQHACHRHPHRGAEHA